MARFKSPPSSRGRSKKPVAPVGIKAIEQFDFMPGSTVTVYQHAHSGMKYYVGKNGAGKMIKHSYGTYVLDNGRHILDTDVCIEKSFMLEDFLEKLLSFGSLVEESSFVVPIG